MLVRPEQRVSRKSTVCTEGRYAGAVFHTRLGKAKMGMEVEGRSPSMTLLFRSLMQKVLDKAVVT